MTLYRVYVWYSPAVDEVLLLTTFNEVEALGVVANIRSEQDPELWNRCRIDTIEFKACQVTCADGGRRLFGRPEIDESEVRY